MTAGRELFFFALLVLSTFAAAAFAVAAAPALAAELPLPPAADHLPARIVGDCPECAATGYMPCGSPDVAWGRRFAATALLGNPKRGYLATFTMTGSDFRILARATDYEALLAILRDRFAKTRLVVLEDAFTAARVLPTPQQVAVTFPKPLHDCIHHTTHPWGCCVSDCKNECCEKTLGSPTITLTWPDANESITFHYHHTIGMSSLSRATRNHHVRYACLNDAKGELRSSVARSFFP